MPLQWRNQIWQSLEDGAGKRRSGCAAAAVGLIYHIPSIVFRHLPSNSATFGYATEGALFYLRASVQRRKLRASLSGTFRQTARLSYATEVALSISAQLSSDAVSALRKVRVRIRLRISLAPKQFKRLWFYLCWCKLCWRL